MNVEATTSETPLGDAVNTIAPTQPENQTFQENQAAEQDTAVPLPLVHQGTGGSPVPQSSPQGNLVGSVAAPRRRARRLRRPTPACRGRP